MWHVNENNKSVIEEVLKKSQDFSEVIVTIFTEDDNFDIFEGDKYVIAKGFIYLESHQNEFVYINIININKIESIQVKGKK